MTPNLILSEEAFPPDGASPEFAEDSVAEGEISDAEEAEPAPETELIAEAEVVSEAAAEVELMGEPAPETELMPEAEVELVAEVDAKAELEDGDAELSEEAATEVVSEQAESD